MSLCQTEDSWSQVATSPALPKVTCSCCWEVCLRRLRNLLNKESVSSLDSGIESGSWLPSRTKTVIKETLKLSLEKHSRWNCGVFPVPQQTCGRAAVAVKTWRLLTGLLLRASPAVKAALTAAWCGFSAWLFWKAELTGGLKKALGFKQG